MSLNLPDDWGSYYVTCPKCSTRYHLSGCDNCLCEPCEGTDGEGRACKNTKGDCLYHDCAGCGANVEDTREDIEEIYTNYWYCHDCRPYLFSSEE